MCKVSKHITSVVLVVCMLATQARSADLPKLEVVSINPETPWENDWEEVNLTNGGMGVVAKHKNNLQLHLLCYAPYRLIWLYNLNNTGVNKVKKHIEIQRIVGSGSINATMSLLLGFEFQSSPFVITIKCEHRFKLIFSRIHVFVPGDNNLLNNGTTLTYPKNGNRIKCLAANPKTDVILFSYDSNNNKNRVNNTSYNPLDGFKLNETLSGNYVCEAGEDFVNLVPAGTIEQSQYEAELSTNITFVLKTEDMKRMCPNEDTSFLVQGDSSYRNNTRRNITWPDSITNSEIWVNLSGSSKGQVLIKIKKYSHSDLLMMAVVCVIEDVALRFDEIQRGRVTNLWKVGPINPVLSNPNISINSSSQSHYVNSVNGAALGLLGWERLPIELTVPIISNEFCKNGQGCIMYTDEEYYFECITKLFNAELTFWMEFSNASKVPLRNGGLWSVKLERDDREKASFRTWKLSLRLPIDAVAITCQALFEVNSNLYFGDIIYFKTIYATPPEILQSLNNTNPMTQKAFVGQIHFQLICKAVAEPRPTYVWFKDTPNGPKVTNLNQRNFNETSSYGVAEFPSITKSHDGVYGCTAKNRLGQATTHFRIKVFERKTVDNSDSNVTWSIVGLLCVGIGLLICGFGIYRYYIAKAWAKLLRGLTEEEIKEFFEGQPEFLEGRGNVEGDFDVLPYNNDFEIDMNDVELNYQNILGSGEFASVIKGKVKSTSEEVAVKIAKASTSASTFKTMLSEVKILSYIGRHENVIGLVGVNTKQVQNRNLYIFLNLCELGSLEKYLRKHKPTFNNLINENQQITVAQNQSAIEVETDFSTLDLTRWASEIAAGMEFLSQKSIVHADLAARNVLLNQERKIKISDFGMSKKLYESGLYVKQTKSPLPWRWMALESLKTLTFSMESDVWSYGVTLWELFSLGDVPFPNQTWDIDFVQMLTCGIRMGNPKYCTPEIYSKIIGCWDENPTKRPQFSSLRQHFWNLYGSISNQVLDENRRYNEAMDVVRKNHVESIPLALYANDMSPPRVYGNNEDPLGANVNNTDLPGIYTNTMHPLLEQ